MYYNTILQLIAALTNVIGTAYAILSILKLKPKDLYQSLTIEGMDKSDEILLVQRKQARAGISLVIYGWFLQTIFSFCSITTAKTFFRCLLVYCIVTVFLCISLLLTNRIFAKKYYELKKEYENEDMDRHSDGHYIKEV